MSVIGQSQSSVNSSVWDYVEINVGTKKICSISHLYGVLVEATEELKRGLFWSSIAGGGQTCHQRNIIIADIMQSAKKSGSSHGTLTGLIIQFPINNNSSHTLPNQQSQDYSHLNMAYNDNNDEGMGNLFVPPSVEADVDAYDTDREGMGDGMLAPLKSVFDHPLIEKIHVDDGKGGQVPAWRCGFCVVDSRGSLNNIFKGAPNATKALRHVTKIAGDIRPCNGIIPPSTMRLFLHLYQSRAAVKEIRATKKQIVCGSIDDAQVRVFQSVANTGRRQQVLVLVCFHGFLSITPCANVSSMCFLDLICLQLVPLDQVDRIQLIYVVIIMMMIIFLARRGHGLLLQSLLPLVLHQASVMALPLHSLA